MGNYLFPVRSDSKIQLLAHVAAEIPTKWSTGPDGDLPDEVDAVLDKLHPDAKIDSISEAVEALHPSKGILVHEWSSRPHAVIGYHEDLTEEEARKMIAEIETRLGYELEDKKELTILTADEIEDYYPQTAGWNHESEFVAR